MEALEKELRVIRQPRDTQAARLWSWLKKRASFTIVEAAEALEMEYNTVRRYVGVWRKHGAVVETYQDSKEPAGRGKPRSSFRLIASSRPSVWSG